MKPIIGIIVCGTRNKSQFVSEPYIQAITKSGGIPVILPSPFFSLHDFYQNLPSTTSTHRTSEAPAVPSHISTEICKAYYEIFVNFCDGFLFCGGGDITPCLFGEDTLDSSGETDLITDLFQLSLIEYLLQQNKPILGICRGMQILNVAMGGTIWQDLSLRDTPSFCHMQHSLHRFDISHRVSFQKNSKLYNIFGDFDFTNSFHHQAINKLGMGLSAVGQTNDAVIEAIESTMHDFVIGVQWHPECMYQFSHASRKLFSIFVNHK